MDSFQVLGKTWPDTSIDYERYNKDEMYNIKSAFIKIINEVIVAWFLKLYPWKVYPQNSTKQVRTWQNLMQKYNQCTKLWWCKIENTKNFKLAKCNTNNIVSAMPSSSNSSLSLSENTSQKPLQESSPVLLQFTKLYAQITNYDVWQVVPTNSIAPVPITIFLGIMSFLFPWMSTSYYFQLSNH